MRKLQLVLSGALILAASSMAASVDNHGVEPVLAGPDADDRSITNYTDYATWLSDFGASVAENRYAELGDGVIVTSQYSGVGATYTDGDDVTFRYGDSTDGMLLDGDGRIHISFSTPQTAIGVNFPGALQIIGYDDSGNQVFASDQFAGSGTFHFGGVISTEPFTNVELLDWYDDTVYVDDVFYGGDPTATQDSDWSFIKVLY